VAEQRPYRLSGTAADTRLSQIKIVVLLSLGAVFVVVNWMTTQHAARLFGYSPALGQPWCDFPPVGSLYHPWNWMVWWLRWHSDPTLAPLWELCVHEAVYPMVTLTAIAMGAIAVARRGWFQNPSDLHGSARWANARDLRAAGLVDKRRFLPRRLRRIAERAKLLKPFSQRAGVYLGVWRRSHIRECGPTHILVFAPTQSGKGRGIVIPTLLTWPHSVIVHDLKGENWALTAGDRKRLGQLVHDAGPAKRAKRILGVQSGRCDDQAVRKACIGARLVMVGDDHVDPKPLCHHHLFNRADAAIRGDDQRHAPALQHGQGLRMKTVAIDAFRDVNDGIEAE